MKTSPRALLPGLLISAFQLFSFSAWAATNWPVTLMVQTNGALYSQTNFFTRNTNLWWPQIPWSGIPNGTITTGMVDSTAYQVFTAGGGGSVDTNGIITQTSNTVLAAEATRNVATSNALVTAVELVKTNQNSTGTYTNVQPVYDSGTNTISVKIYGVLMVTPPSGYDPGFTWTWNGVGYTNTVGAGNKRTSILTNGVVAFWANATGTTLFTNIAPGQIYGVYRSNTTLGAWLMVQPTFTTNVIAYTTNLIRGTEISLADFGYRPDGVTIYSMSVSNSVATVPGGQFNASDLGKFIHICTDAGATNFYLTRIVTINNATNITVGSDVQSLVATGVRGSYGSGNYFAWSNALATTGNLILTVPVGLGLIEQAVYDGQTGNNVAIKLPATQSFNVTNSQSRTIVIKGEKPAMIYPQFTVGGASISYPVDGSMVMNIAKASTLSGGRNVFVQHSWSNRVTSVPPQFAAERIIIQDITFRQPVNNGFDGLWFDTGGTIHLKDVQVDKDIPAGFLNISTGDPAFWERGWFDDSTNACVGLWGPGVYNYAGMALQNVTISYYGLGARFGEHTISDGKLSIVGCDTGVYFDSMITNTGSQGAKCDLLFVYRSRYPIMVNSNSLREIAEFASLQFETQGSRVNYHILDPAQKFKFFAGTVCGPETPNVQSTNGVWYDPISGVWNGHSVRILEGGFITNANIFAGQLTGTLPLATLPSAVVTNNATGISLGGGFTGGFKFGAGATGGVTNSGGAEIINTLGNYKWNNGNTFLRQDDSEDSTDYFQLAYANGTLLATNGYLSAVKIDTTNLLVTGNLIATNASRTNVNLVGGTTTNQTLVNATFTGSADFQRLTLSNATSSVWITNAGLGTTVIISNGTVKLASGGNSMTLETPSSSWSIKSGNSDVIGGGANAFYVKDGFIYFGTSTGATVPMARATNTAEVNIRSNLTSGIITATVGFNSTVSNSLPLITVTSPWTNTYGKNYFAYVTVTAQNVSKNGTTIYSSLTGTATVGVKANEILTATGATIVVEPQ